MNRIFIFLLLAGIADLFSQENGKMADVIYLNGKIWTVDPLKPQAEAFAIKDGKFIAVGTNDELKKWLGKRTEQIDLNGQRVVPGFIDDHTHFISGGFYLMEINLRDSKNEKDFANRIAEHAKNHPGEWITHGRWDHEAWPGANLPKKELIDSFTSTTPVFVTRYDGHMALANSFVLQKARINRNTPDPLGGMIVKDPKTGEPTGILKDAAMDVVEKIIPEHTTDELFKAAEKGLAEARRFGVTGIQDMSEWNDIDVYRKLKNQGKLTARFFCRIPISIWETVKEKNIQAGDGDDWIRLGSLKGYADGSLGSSTALFLRPYVQDPNTFGLERDVVQDGRFEKWAMAADRSHLQICVHSIGDSANRIILNLFEKIEKENPEWDRRPRMEHAQHLSPADLTRFVKLGVIPSMQPYHCIEDGGWAEKRIGPGRCKTTHAFRSLLDTGARLSFGSDWPVATLDPILGIYAAVTRRTVDGKNPNGWIPEQKISVAEALQAYTLNNAFASFEENQKGSISPGKLADFVILSDDIFAISPEQIETVKVVTTVIDGKIVYKK